MTQQPIPNWLLILLLSFFGIISAKPVDHLLQISVDGLRGDLLGNLVTNDPANFPNFYRLQTEGAFTYNARCDVNNSSTIPNHSSMITGRPVLQPAGTPNTTHHGFTSNFPGPNETYHNSGNPNLGYVFSTFDMTHDHGLSTACYLGKTRLTIVWRSYNADNGGPDMIGDDNGGNKIDSYIVQDGFSDNMLLEISSNLSNAPVNYTFLHIVEPDIPGGHSFGWGSADWEMWVKETDNYLGELFDAIDSNPSLNNNMAVILTADHGGGGEVFTNHRDPSFRENYTIPFFVWAPGARIPAGMDLYDLLLNRDDPGTGQPSYSDPSQPVWAGDSGNLALALLGLPVIPDSFLLPELPPSEVMVAIQHLENDIILEWPITSPTYVLESAGSLASPVEWSKVVSENLIQEEDNYSLTIPKTEALAREFFRLREVAFRIAGQPQSQTVQAGQTAVFNVEVSGDGVFTYQWAFNGATLPGETGSTLTLTNLMPNQSGQYDVVVSDGIDSVMSEPAILSLILGPTISQQPVSLVVTSGLSATFIVEAAGADPLTYQWKFNGEDLPGATNESYSIDPVEPSKDGAYTVEITDAFGTTLSEPATLTSLVVPTFVVVPMGQTVNVGDTVTFTVTIDGNPAPYGYRWRRGSLTVASEVSDQLTSTLVLTNVQTSDGGRYSVVVTNSASGYFPGILSPPGTLTVLDP